MKWLFISNLLVYITPIIAILYLSIYSYKYKFNFIHELIMFLVLSDIVLFLSMGLNYHLNQTQIDITSIESSIFYSKLPILLFLYYLYFRFIMSIYKPDISRYLSYSILVMIAITTLPVILFFKSYINIQSTDVFKWFQIAFFIISLLFIQTTSVLLILGYQSKRRKTLYFYYLFTFFLNSYFVLYFMRILNLFGLSEADQLSERALIFLQLPMALFVGYGLRNNIFLSTPSTKKGELEHVLKSVYLLSEREIEVIQCILESMTNKDIAQNLYISVSTVNRHIYNIFKKMGINSKVQLLNKLDNYK